MRKIAVIALLAASACSAQVKVLASNGVKAALEAMKPAAEKAAGQPLVIEWGSSAALKKAIAAGEAFDVAILTPEATADMIKAGKIAAGSAVDMAHTGIGFGIRAGAAKPDISTPDAVKQTLLKAKSISIVKEGASRATVDRMFDKLGVAAAVASKTELTDGTETSGEHVSEGKAEIEIVPLSEVPLVHGVEILGPLPGDLQNTLHFQASLGASAKAAAGAKKVIQYLTSPAAEPVLRSKGMEPK